MALAAAQVPRGRPIDAPGEPAGDLAEHLGLDDPHLQQQFLLDLERVRDAELRAEYDSDGIRLR